MHRVQALVDSMRGMSSEVLMATTKHGDLHLQVDTTGGPVGWCQGQCAGLLCWVDLTAAAVPAPGVEFGTEIRGLSVLPAGVTQGLDVLQ